MDSIMQTMTDDITYRAPEAADLAGITYRMLDWYARTGIVVPSVEQATGSGSARVYSRADVERLLKVVTLRNAGVRLKTIREHGVTGTVRRLRQALETIGPNA